MANVIFHPFLLFLITYTIKPLGEKNTDLIISGLNSVISGNETPLIRIKDKKERIFVFYFLNVVWFYIFIKFRSGHIDSQSAQF